MKTPSPQELAALVHRLKYLAGPTILTPCAESDAADALTAQAARIAELEQTVALQSQQRISESVDANVRLGNVERECAELRKDRERLISPAVKEALSNAVVLLRGWHSDGTAWSEWDTKVEADLCVVQQPNRRRLAMNKPKSFTAPTEQTEAEKCLSIWRAVCEDRTVDFTWEELQALQSAGFITGLTRIHPYVGKRRGHEERWVFEWTDRLKTLAESLARHPITPAKPTEGRT